MLKIARRQSARSVCTNAGVLVILNWTWIGVNQFFGILFGLFEMSCWKICLVFYQVPNVPFQALKETWWQMRQMSQWLSTALKMIIASLNLFDPKTWNLIAMKHLCLKLVLLCQGEGTSKWQCEKWYFCVLRGKGANSYSVQKNCFVCWVPWRWPSLH